MTEMNDRYKMLNYLAKLDNIATLSLLVLFPDETGSLFPDKTSANLFSK